ncbi:hypothetical protein TanjilG_20437 [Lupinus angustifolius]|uniref:DNA-directed RNA polymerase RBP11-like dimerisation domain-containing protein n=1 Tax=Lupinus angustifolius TaxID=3871 RepID=A0A1J7FNL4_LUPAN|nr:hypothetical protein TanjilG_20437 [Lupinus angustifolius]
MNAPDRYERFVVPEGTKKVSYERDTKIINAASFTIEREDHTVGNILRMYNLNPLSLFLFSESIHTTSQSSPMQAYNQSINDLDRELDQLKNAFEVYSYLFLSFCNFCVQVKFFDIIDTCLLSYKILDRL